MTDAWHYQAFGREFGPVPFEMIGELAERGQLAPDDLLRRGPSGDWIPAGSIDGLFPSSPPTTAPEDDPLIVHDLSDLEFTFADSKTPAPPTRGVARSAPLARTWVEPPPIDRPHLARSTAGEGPAGDSELEMAEALQRSTEVSGRAAVGPDNERVSAPRGGEWHALSLGIELGPVPLVQLAEMIERGELSGDDSVREREESGWRRVSSVPELVAALSRVAGDAAPAPSPARPADRPEAAERATSSDTPARSEKPPSPRRRRSARQMTEGKSRPRPESATPTDPDLDEAAYSALLDSPTRELESPAREAVVADPGPAASPPAPKSESRPVASSPVPPVATPPVVAASAGTPASVSRTPPAPAPRKEKEKRPKGRKATSPGESSLAPKALAVALVLLAGILGWRYMPSLGSDRKTYEQFAAVYSEMKGLREKQASDDDWTDLTNRVKTDVMPVVKTLEKTAGAKYPIKQNLLWAGKYHLLPMLGSARKAESKDEQDFAMYLETARKLLDGEPIAMAPSNSDSE